MHCQKFNGKRTTILDWVELRPYPLLEKSFEEHLSIIIVKSKKEELET